MLRMTVLVAFLASAAFGSVANICAVDFYRQMQGYRDSEPAIEVCSSHYAAQTITKTLPATCLTTTKTVILGTSTVHATTRMACPTDSLHHEIRDAAELEKRDAVQERDTDGEQWYRLTYPKKWARAKAYKERHGEWPQWWNNWRHQHPSPYTRTHTRPHTHTPTTTHSHHPYEVINQREATPTPTLMVKRDSAPVKTADWPNYYSSLVDCGYDCVQRACSCVATGKVEMKTPAPTCTSTTTTETFVHVTHTVEAAPLHC